MYVLDYQIRSAKLLRAPGHGRGKCMFRLLLGGQWQGEECSSGFSFQERNVRAYLGLARARYSYSIHARFSHLPFVGVDVHAGPR